MLSRSLSLSLSFSISLLGAGIFYSLALCTKEVWLPFSLDAQTAPVGGAPLPVHLSAEHLSAANSIRKGDLAKAWEEMKSCGAEDAACIALQAERRLAGAGAHQTLSEDLPSDPQAACSVKGPRDSRVFLNLVCLWYHGSTALEMVLMSSRKVSTLCTAETHQCEGDKILKREHIPGWTGEWVAEHAYGYVEHGWPALEQRNYSHMVGVFSRYWDLNRPVLMTKAWHPGIAHAHDGIHSAVLPSAMIQNHVRRLSLAYTLMWTPLCLRQFNSPKPDHFFDWNAEIQLLGELKKAHEILTLRNATLLVISYADLLWNPRKVVQRLDRFLPCASPFCYDVLPKKGVDVYRGNGFKVSQSTYEFGKLHPPEMYGYDVVQQECARGWALDLFNTSQVKSMMRLHKYFAQYT